MNVSTQQAASTMAMVVLPQSVWEGMKSLLIKRNKEEAGSEWIESVEARKMLGVSPKTWQTYRDRRVIPFAQIGRKILVKKADLDAFMREHYISTEK